MVKSGELSYSLPSFLYDTGFFLFCLRGEEGWFYETKKLKKLKLQEECSLLSLSK